MGKLKDFLKKSGTGTYSVKLTLGSYSDKLESGSGKNMHIALTESDPQAANGALCSLISSETGYPCEVTSGRGDARFKKVYIRV